MKKLILASALVFASSHAMHEECTIKPFDKERDEKFVFDLLEQEEENIMIASQPTRIAQEKICSSTRYITKVLFKGNIPIGFVTFSKEKPLCFFAAKGTIDLFAIDSAHRKKGHGKRLLSHALEALSDDCVNEVGTFVNRSNQTAIKLLSEKLNFEHRSMLPELFFNYYTTRVE